MFHPMCITGWTKIKPTCPICRASLLMILLKYQDNQIFDCLLTFSNIDILFQKLKSLKKLFLLKIKNLKMNKQND